MIGVIAVGTFLFWQHRKSKLKRRAVNREKEQLRRLRVQLFELTTGNSITKFQFSGFTRKTMKINIGFDNISLTVRDNGKQVLRGTTGQFQSGHLYAVMGPSGCGKTSFLNTLTGKGAGYGIIKGRVLVNGVEMQTDSYRSVMGFVPQTDSVHTSLTVRENLMYSARLRLPSQTSDDALENIVQDVITVLQLGHIQDSLVGSIEEKRRISGGQRKRVNVGIELVADPTILFLDEPTTGLDSSGAYDVISALKNMTKLGWTIVTVIHQPRYSIFTLFDQVLLLGMGGYTGKKHFRFQSNYFLFIFFVDILNIYTDENKCDDNSVYLGPSIRAVEYFESLGFDLPQSENPADTILDVIAGQVPLRGQGFDAAKLPEMWNERSSKYQTELIPKEEEEKKYARRSSIAYDRFGLTSTLEDQFNKYDKNQSGTLSIEEFQAMFAESLGVEYTEDIKKLVGVLFLQLDDTGKGSITKQDLVRLFLNDSISSEPEHKLHQTPSDVDEMMEKIENIAGQMRSHTQVAAKKARRFLLRKIPALVFHRSSKWTTSSVTQIAKPMSNEEAMLRKYGEKPNGLFQFFEFLQRAVIQSWRAGHVKLFEIVIISLATFIIGSMQGSGWKFSATAPNVMLGHLAFALLSSAASLRCMGWTYEKMMFWREASSGLNRFSYFMGKNVAEFFDIVLRAIVFSLIYFYLTSPQLSFGDFLGVSLLFSWSTSGLGYLISTWLFWDDAQVACLVITLILCGFINGVNPTLESYKGGIMMYICALSPSRWSVEAVAMKVASNVDQDFPNAVGDYLAVSGYEIDNYDNDLIALFVLGIAYRVFAYLLLTRTNKNQQL
jgi:ABC-type multidrug transport system ATPase subunit